MTPSPIASLARNRALWLLCAFVLALVACSDDPEEVPPETTAPDTTTAVILDTTTTAAAPQVDTTAPTTTTTVPDEEFPGPTVLAYLEEIRNIAVATGQVALDMRAANNDWDNRSVTGVRYPDTEAALVAVRDRTRQLRDAIGLVEPPNEFGLPVEHQTAWEALGEMADAAVEALAGLRSPDTGERRRAALSDFIVAFERFNGAVSRIVDIIDVGGAIDLPTITVATTVATTTTTTAATTATTSAAPTTTGATTTTVAATTTTTLSAVVEHSIVDSGGDSSDPVQLWMTVSVEVGTTKKQLAELGARLATEYRLSRDYQALIIHFVRFPEGIATLGRWTDAPHGDWERAGEATKGDYSTHQIVDETIEKDWSLLPTDEQMDVFRKYNDYRTAYQIESGVSPPDSELIPLAAVALGLEEAAIEEAIDAWSAWVGY
ncbi:MAG: hypothetical protein F4Y40_13340 [Acidimicrobiia bacterium]|nr:hypothetical protein [Acidimicrobiia bacterium]MYF84411.1 hypothetical protein [Acidimicrobiia bacterium]